MTNNYSRRWFELFLETRPYTDAEIAFLHRHLPLPAYMRVLDICCGQGRHTNRLAALGYQMLGLDRDTTAITIARQQQQPNASYLIQDMRDLMSLAGPFDAILLLWQSFGYFDAASNEAIIRDISGLLRPQGRFILDIYNRLFWQEPRTIQHTERNGVAIRITNTVNDNRFSAALDYSDGSASDHFDWQLYSLPEIIEIAARYQLSCILTCTEYQDDQPPSAAKPLMQLIFEKQSRDVADL